MARHPDVIGRVSKNVWLQTHLEAEEPPVAVGRKTDWYPTFYILIRICCSWFRNKTSPIYIWELEASLGWIAGKWISIYLSQNPICLLKEKWLHDVTCQSGIRHWGRPPISKSAGSHSVDAKCLFQPRPQTLHNITENELPNCHETCLMSLFWRIQGSSSAEQYYNNKSERCGPTHQRSACQKDSERFQILQVIWGNIWCNESRKTNRSSISEGGHTDLP